MKFICLIIISLFSISCYTQKEISLETYRIYNCDSKFTSFDEQYDNQTGEYIGIDSCSCSLINKNNISDGLYLIYTKDSTLTSRTTIVNGIAIRSMHYNCNQKLTSEIDIIGKLIVFKDYYENGNPRSVVYRSKGRYCGSNQYFNPDGSLVNVVIHNPCNCTGRTSSEAEK